MKVQITDYSKDRKLSEAIDRHYTLLRMTFDMTGIYKIFETCDSHMNTSVYPGNDYTIIFDKMKQYNDDNLLTDADFLKSDEIIVNNEIRDFIQICKELNDSSQGCVYDTFS